MSTYYQYQDVKRMIAHKLMTMEGWKVYGYSPDQSDIMSDYYCPAHWGGVATKNGYTLCVDVYGAEEEKQISAYTGGMDAKTAEKISKLEKMTMERGASAAEEASAKAAIQKLKEEQERTCKIIEIIPGHMENPPRCNWHIEKDGMYIAKGTGILKYAEVSSYLEHAHIMETMQKYRKNPTAYIEDLKNYYVSHGYYSRENAGPAAKTQANNMAKDDKILKQFENFIKKIDALCGGLLGEGDPVQYERKTFIQYKTELKAIETTSGSLQEGQCFILKSEFTNGFYAGNVYRIHRKEYNGKEYWIAQKLNKKLEKECTGISGRGNTWYMDNMDQFKRWMEKGAISWCNLETVKTPYEVEKIVKKKA